MRGKGDSVVFCRAEFLTERLGLGIWEQELGKVGEMNLGRQTESKTSMEEMKLQGILTRTDDI